MKSENEYVLYEENSIYINIYKYIIRIIVSKEFLTLSNI